MAVTTHFPSHQKDVSPTPGHLQRWACSQRWARGCQAPPGRRVTTKADTVGPQEATVVLASSGVHTWAYAPHGSMLTQTHGQYMVAT